MRPACLLAVLLLAACQRPAPAEPPKAAPAPAAGGAVNPSTRVIDYRCENGETIRAGYPDRGTAIIDYQGHAYVLKQATAASGVRYTGYGLQWWTKGMDQAMLAVLKPGEEIASAPSLNCSTAAAAPVSPPPPGTPGGLPDDRTPVSEAPFTATSAQGAANVVQTYYALVGEGRYAESARLRSDGKPGDFSAYSSYHAQVGAPGEIEGAAGSVYVEVPVIIYGRMVGGAELHQSGKAVLRRSNDVPGATPEQRRWRIERIELKP